MKKLSVLLVLSVLIIFFIIQVNLGAAPSRNLTVCAFDSYPLIYKDMDGHIKGFYPDLLKKIGEKEDLHFEYVFGSWQESLDRIRDGRADLMPGVGYSDERARYMEFSRNSILTVWGELYCPPSSSISGMLDLKSKRIAVLKGDIFAKNFLVLASQFAINCVFIEVYSYEDVFKAVASGKADAGIVDVTFGTVKQRDYGLRSTGIVFNPLKIYYTTQKNRDRDLLNLLDRYLEIWQHQPDSVYEKAKFEWMYGSVGSVPVVPEWLVKTLIFLGCVIGVGACFILLLKMQICKATLKIKDKEQQISSVSNNFQSGMIYQLVIRSDGSRKFTHLSDSVRNLYGITPEEGLLNAKLIYQCVHEDDLSRLIEIEDAAVKAQTTFRAELRIREPSGKVRWSCVVSTPRKLSDGSTCLDGVELVITERKESETAIRLKNEELEAVNEELTAAIEELEHTNEELSSTNQQLEKAEAEVRTSEAKFRSLAESSPMAIMIYQNDVWIYTNPAGEHITGYSADELYTMHYLDFVAPEDSAMVLQAGRLRISGQEAPLSYDLNIITKTGERKDFYFIGRLIEYEGKPAGLVVASDITEVKRAEKEKREMEEKLRLVEKMEVIGQLAGGIAHDFNNLLTGIIGAAKLLTHVNLLPDKRQEYIAIIMNAARRGAELTAKILTFSRKRARRSEVVDLSRIIRESIAILQRTIDKKVEILFESTAQYVTTTGDDTMLENVFMNMGINAGHAMADGGTLIFRVSNVFLDNAACTFIPFKITPGNYVNIEIQDTGCGIDPEVLKHIFEPFFTTKEEGKGTGLGLSTVYGTIRDHHGALRVYSEIGKGTLFHVYLPLTDDVPESSAVSKEPVKGTGQILLIDDEENIRQTTKGLLESIGYSVVTAPDGASGAAMYQQLHQQIDIVILDMIMPVMGGKEVFRRIKEINSNAKIILASGFSREEDLTMMKEQGLCCFIRKPFRFAELSECIAKAMTCD